MIVDVSKVPEHGTTFLLYSHYWLLQFGDDFVQNAPIWTLVPLTVPSPRWLWLRKAVVPRTGGSWIGLRCVASLNYSTWSSQLVWVENAHNSMTSSVTGVSPFEASLGYQSPLLSVSEGELPSLQSRITCIVVATSGDPDPQVSGTK